MASTPEGRRLTEQHRQAQQQVRDDFLAEFILLWALLDSARLDETGPGWIQAVMRLVRSFRRISAAVAADYFWEFQLAEAPNPRPRPRIPGGVVELPDASSRPGGPIAPPAGPRTGRPPRRREDGLQGRRPRPETIVPERSTRVRFEIDEDAFRPRGDRRPRVSFYVPELDEERLDRATEVSLIVTGPVAQKSKRARGKTERQARDESFVESAGAASRHVLTGGRQSLLTLVQENMPTPRWARVTDGDPCAFCAMLAARGAVYVSEASAKFEAHDGCACTAEPVYYADSPLPGRGPEFRQLWNDHIRKRYSGAEARRQWRRLYEQMQREARDARVA